MVVKNKKVKLDNAKKGSVILFSNNNYPKGCNCDNDDLMVMTSTVHNYAIKRILVDQGNLANILYNIAIASMNIHKVDLKPHIGNLIRFSSKQVAIEGIMRLRVTMGMWTLAINMDINFLIVNTPNMTYNVILGRMSLNKIRTIVLTPHLLMKFLTTSGISQV